MNSMRDIRYCFVCRKSQHKVVWLNAALDVSICDECIWTPPHLEWLKEHLVAYQILGTGLLINRTLVVVLIAHLLLALGIHQPSIVGLLYPHWSLCYCISTLLVAVVLAGVIHEVGHAIAAVVTGCGVRALYVGMPYPGALNGWCWPRVWPASLFKYFLTILAGPLANLIVAVAMTGGIVSGYTQPDGPLRLLYLLLIMTNAYFFILSLIPNQKGTSDGAQLLVILKRLNTQRLTKIDPAL